LTILRQEEGSGEQEGTQQQMQQVEGSLKMED